MPPHILVVEDCPTQAQAVQRALESAGYKTELARSGEEELARFNAAPCGVDVHFMGQTSTITSDREQILDLLASTFEDAVRQNQSLRVREDEPRLARAELANYTERRRLPAPMPLPEMHETAHE